MVIYSTTPVVNEPIIMTEPFLNMIQGLYLDPSFFPVTIIFIVLVLFSFWQKLARYVPHLIVVYLAFLLFTATSYRVTSAFPQEGKKNIVEDSKKLLDLFGIPHIQAPSEGEATAASLTTTGLAYASASQDFDSILFGAKRLVRNFTNSGRRKLPNRNSYIEVLPEIIEYQKNLDSMGLNREELVDVGILIGTDFNPDGEFRDVSSIDIGDYKLEKPEQPRMLFKDTDVVKMDKVEIKVNDTFKTAKINCASCHVENNNYEIYLMANGYVSPCCYIGDLDQHEPKNIINDCEKVNINHTSLQEILEGKFFRDLENGIAGKTGSYRLQSCYMTCGVR